MILYQIFVLQDKVSFMINTSILTFNIKNTTKGDLVVYSNLINNVEQNDNKNLCFVVYTNGFKIVDISTKQKKTVDTYNYIHAVFHIEENAINCVEYIKSIWKIHAWYKTENFIDFDYKIITDKNKFEGLDPYSIIEKH